MAPLNYRVKYGKMPEGNLNLSVLSEPVGSLATCLKILLWLRIR